MYHTHLDIWKDHLCVALKEDGWPWDWTSLGALKSRSSVPEIQAQVVAKSDGIWAAESLLTSLARIASHLCFENKVKDGQKFRTGDVLVDIKGPVLDVLAWERPFLNLAAYASGIATVTHHLVEKVKKACPRHTPRVCLTRKTLPGYRDVAVHSVRLGGGFPHRVTLSGGVLIKENHIAVAGSILNAITGARDSAPHGLKIEVEVRSIEELEEAVEAEADGVLLDNFSPEQAQAALKFLKRGEKSPFVEISGGLHEGNIVNYALEGVDVLSSGSLTHSVKSVDLSLLVKAAD